MKKRWGVLRTAVLIRKVRPEVPSEDEKCPSDDLDEPQQDPANFIAPNQTQANIVATLSRWDSAIRQLVLQATAGKGKVSPASEADATNELPPQSVLAPRISRGCTASEPPVLTSGLRWRRVIHQLVSENDGSKKAAAPASYSPSLPTPVGPFPPPAFAYSSPAHGDLIISEAENETEIASEPVAAYSSDLPPTAFTYNLV